MAITERLALLIDADGKGAVREMQTVGKAAERELGRAETRIDRMASGFQSAGIKMMATSAVVGAGMWSAGQSAADLEQAVGGTAAVFGESASAVEDFAGRSASAAGLSERAARELTSQLGALLQGFGFTGDEAAGMSVELAQLGADLAATFGGKPEEAVQALGAALRGEFDPLERFGVSLNVSQANLKAVEMGLASSTSQVDLNARAQASYALIMERSSAAQGQFARETDTTAGQMAITTAEFENAKAELGAGFLPVMTQVSGAASGLIGMFGSLDSATGGMASSFVGFGTVALGAAGAVSWVAGKVMESRDMFMSAGKKALDFATNLGVSRNAAMMTGGALGALGIALAAGVVLWQQHAQAQREADARAKAMLDTLDAQTGALTEQSAAMILSNERYADNVDNLERAGVAQEELRGALEDSSVTGDEWMTVVHGLIRGDEDYATASADLVASLRGRGDAMSQLILKMHEAGELGEGEVQLLRDEAAATAASKQLREANVGVMGEEAAARRGLAGSTEDQAAAEAEAIEVTDEWTVRQDELNKELSAAQSELDGLTKQVLAYFDSLDGAVDAEMELHSALDSMRTTLDENGTAWNWNTSQIDLSTEAGRENMQAFQDTRDAIVAYGQQQFEATGSVEAATSATTLLTSGLREQMAQTGYTKEQQDALLTSLGLTPDQITTAFNQPGMAEAYANTAGLRNELAWLPVEKVITIRVREILEEKVADFNPLGALFGGGRASGGPVDAGRAYLVGEEGPELVVPRSAGTVVPADRTAAMVGAGGDQVIHVSVELDGQKVGEGLNRVSRAHGGRP